MATRTDTFDRADSTSLGSDWAEDSGNWAIVSNNVRNNTSGGSYRKLRWTGTALASANYSVSGTYRSGSSSIGIGPAARCVESSTISYYALIIFGGDAAYLIYINAGAETVLDTGSAITVNTNYELRIEVDGTTIRGYVNGVLDLEATNSALSSGSPGIAGYGGGNSNTYVTTWTAADLATGTTYYGTPSGSVGLAGSIVKRPARALAGALGLAGTTAKRTARAVSGALGLAGSVAKRTSKNLAGAVGLAGALAAARTAIVSVSGSLGLSGSLAKQTARSVGGSIAPSGALAKRVDRILSGALGLAGSLSSSLIQLYQVALSGALGLAGSVSRRTSRSLSGALGLAGSASRAISRLLSGVLGLAGSLLQLIPFKADCTLATVSPYTVALATVSPYTATLATAAPYTVALATTAPGRVLLSDEAPGAVSLETNT